MNLLKLLFALLIGIVQNCTQEFQTQAEMNRSSYRSLAAQDSLTDVMYDQLFDRLSSQLQHPDPYGAQWVVNQMHRIHSIRVHFDSVMRKQGRLYNDFYVGGSVAPLMKNQSMLSVAEKEYELLQNIKYHLDLIAPPESQKESTVMAIEFGDLDGDGLDEMVTVYETSDSTKDGAIRRLLILKRIQGSWKYWKHSAYAIKKSGEGGMGGEPFRMIDIVDQQLIIIHGGGSSWKWTIQDKYKLNEDQFRLIESKRTYGKLCEYWVDVKWRADEGILRYSRKYEKCQDQEQSFYKIENDSVYVNFPGLGLQNRFDDSQTVRVLGSKYEVTI